MFIVLSMQLLTGNKGRPALGVRLAVWSTSTNAALALKATFLKKLCRGLTPLPVVAKATPLSPQWDPSVRIQTMLCPNMGVACCPHE